MTAEQNSPRPKESVFHKPLDVFHSGPDVHTAAAHGLPNMEPETESSANSDILSGVEGSTKRSGTGKTGIVATVKPGEAAPEGSPAAGGSSEDVNSNSSSDPASSAPAAATPESSSNNPAGGANASAGSSTSQPTNGTASDSSTQASNDSNQKESSSKKKGLKKLLPW